MTRQRCPDVTLAAAAAAPALAAFLLAGLLAVPATAQRVRAVRALDSWHRLETSRDRLVIQWRQARRHRGPALEPADALRVLRGKDPRPLLIVRASADRRVSEAIDRLLRNERVRLATRWFHCVQVGAEVTAGGHPFASLFDGRRPAHVIMASADGSRVVKTFRTAAQKLSWRGLTSFLDVDYAGSASRAVKELAKLLNVFDRLDERRRELQRQLASASAKRQASRVEVAHAQIARLEAARAEALATEQRWQALELRGR